MKRLLTLIFLLTIAAALHAQLAKATVIAGGTWQYLAPFVGKPATSAPFGYVSSLTIDPAGNLVFVDQSNFTVGKISSQGILISLAAGPFTGVGENIPTFASGFFPSAVSDAAGNVYFSEPNSYDVKKVTPNGTASVFAGTGRAPNGSDPPSNLATQTPLVPENLGIDGAGNVYIYAGAVYQVNPTGQINRTPAGGTYGRMAVDAAGTIYVASNENDFYSSSRNVIVYDGTQQTTVTALNGVFMLGIAVDSQGNIYVTTLSQVLRVNKLSTSTYASTATVVAGTGTQGFSGDGGPATKATFSFGMSFNVAGGGIAVDSTGNIYVGDCSNSRIRKIDTNGTVTTFAGSGNGSRSIGDGGPATSALFGSITALASDSAGNLYTLDPNSGGIVRRIDATGTINAFAGSRQGSTADGIPATQAQISAFSMAFSPAGELWFTTQTGLRKINAAGIITTPLTYVANGAITSDVFDSSGNLYAIQANRVIIKYSQLSSNLPTGTATSTVVAGSGATSSNGTGDGGPPLNAPLDPTSLAIDHSGNLFIADGANNFKIRELTSSGVLSTFAIGSGSSAYPQTGRLATDSAGNLFVIGSVQLANQPYQQEIVKVSPSGAVSTIFTTASTDLNFGIAAFDSSGHLYVTASDGNGVTQEIFRFDALAPSITSFSPSSATSGAKAFTLTVTGSGFDVDSMVQWNGSLRTTTYVSSTQLTAQITAADIATAGAANITVFNPGLGGATSSPFSFNFGAPVFTSASIVNGASFQAGVAPGSIVSIFGSNLATATTVAATLPLPASLGGTKVTLNGTPLPLFFVSPAQVNAQLPFSASSGPLVINNASASLSQSIVVTSSSPGIFRTTGLQGAILNPDYTLTDATNPARGGSIVMMYCTGLGAVTQSVTEGSPSPAATTVVTPLVYVNGSLANVVYSGLAPGFAGLYQINFVVPPNSPIGTSTVMLLMNGITSNSATMATQ